MVIFIMEDPPVDTNNVFANIKEGSRTIGRDRLPSAIVALTMDEATKIVSGVVEASEDGGTVLRD